jgi:hypothetical protein
MKMEVVLEILGIVATVSFVSSIVEATVFERRLVVQVSPLSQGA